MTQEFIQLTVLRAANANHFKEGQDMKYYKIKIIMNGTKFIYPTGYVGKIDKHNRSVLYFDVYPDKFKMIALPNNIIFQHQNVEELSLAEAKAIADEHRPKTTSITDEGLLRIIEIKARTGEELSNQERKAIDPEDKTPGVNWKKSLGEQLEELDINE